MINKLYFDLDDCVLYSTLNSNPGHSCLIQTLNEWCPYEKKIVENTYYTKIRPCALNLFKFAQSILGDENVYILTNSSTEYSSGINNHAGFVLPERLLTRTDLDNYQISNYDKPGNKNNAIIDNLPPKYNLLKTTFIGITDHKRYCETPNYFGLDLDEDIFEKAIQTFIIDTHHNE